MSNYILNRDAVVTKLKEELVGPAPAGAELDCTKPVTFRSVTETYAPFFQKGNGEEILHRDSPLSRYGAGIIYPLPPPPPPDPSSETKGKYKIDENWTGKITFEDDEPPENSESSSSKTFTEESTLPDSINSAKPDFLNLAAANKFLPNSMGISFLAEAPKGTRLIVTVSGGRYRKLPVTIEKKSRIWWRREPVEITASFQGVESSFDSGKIAPSKIISSNTEGLDLSVEIFVRPTKKSNQYLLTAVLVNRTIVLRGLTDDECALFQSEFTVRVISQSGNHHILPYPQTEYSDLSEEDESINLLYRRKQNFAVGHGCAADWDREVGDNQRVKKVVATPFPVFETPPVTSEIRRADGTILEIPMAKLAGLIPGDDGIEGLIEMRDEYEGWINRRASEIPKLPPRYHHIANLHLSDCRTVLSRIRDGIDLLRENPKARKAFRLANHAILIQQHRSKMPLRNISLDKKNGEIKFSSKNIDPDLLSEGSGLGKWRPFQIAFLLMSLRSTVDPDCDFRETVELIWFPTAGGKTECYLALAAFAIFNRRLTNPEDCGTHVFMRYTLRLLTAQQFQRAVALVCAMEYLRQQDPISLGKTEFSIGLWLGNEVTPGTGRDALQVLKSLQNYPHTTQNKFILNRCPWCAVELGKVENIDKGGKKGGSTRKQSISSVTGKKKALLDFIAPTRAAAFTPISPFTSPMRIFMINVRLYILRRSINLPSWHGSLRHEPFTGLTEKDTAYSRRRA